jgi:mono/diheme cytochrome c family protein
LSMEEKKPLVNLAVKSLLILIGVYLFFKYGYGYISMWITRSPLPQHLPDNALKLYIAFTILGIFIYITSSEARKKNFLGPLEAFLAGRQGAFLSIIRIVVLVLLPLVVGFIAYDSVVPKLVSLGGIRIMHPTMPSTFEGLVSPAREPTEEAVKEFMAALDFQGSAADAKAALAEKNMMDGRVSYAKNCRPCHGMQANGKGPHAWGWTLKPADFTDAGILPTVVEPYAFWRVSKGGAGLPPASTPWDSSMPIWDLNLSEHMMWQVLLGAYDLAGVSPRQTEVLDGHE